LDTAQADQNIAEQAQFMGRWLDDETLRAEFDAIIAAAWPAEQTGRTCGRIPQHHAYLMPRLPHPTYGGGVSRPADHQGGCGVDQHGRERSPPVHT
jgi:hypothetical protein